MIRQSRSPRVIVVAILALLAAFFSAPTSAVAAETPHMSPLYFNGGDVIYNYDFTTNQGASNQTVDWATSLLYYNNASINKIKGFSFVSAQYPTFGSTAYGWVNDGHQDFPQGPYINSPGYYDTDGGMKQSYFNVCFGSTRHSRLYADSDDRLYSIGLGFYVYATTHVDYHEGCHGYFGDSEATEKSIGDLFYANGYPVYREYASFFNPERRHIDSRDSNHNWDNSGRATYIYIY